MTRKRAVDAKESTDNKFARWKARFKAVTGAFEQGKLTEARTLLYKSSLEAEGLQDKDYAVPVCNIGMAIISMEQGKLDEAKQFFDKGLNSISHKSDPASREMYAAGLIFKAIWHERQGDLTEAERCLKESVDVLKDLGADAAVQLAYSLSDLGFILARTDRIDEAEPLVMAAMEILSATVGRDDATYDWAKMIYQACANSSDDAMLAETFEYSVTKLQYKVGAHHPNLTRALNIYAAGLKKRGMTDRLKQAEKSFSALLQQ